MKYEHLTREKSFHIINHIGLKLCLLQTVENTNVHALEEILKMVKQTFNC